MAVNGRGAAEGTQVTQTRILYLIDSLVPGGAETSLVAMAPLLRERGIALEVAYLHERPGLHSELRAAGVPVTSVDGGSAAGRIRRTVALVRARRPDLLHTTLLEADIAGRIAGTLARTRVVASLVNTPYGPEQYANPALRSWKLGISQAAAAASMRGVARYHAITTHVAEVMARRLRIDRARIDVVPRGRDPETLGTRTSQRRARARTALGAPRGTEVVLVAARQSYQKGIDVLLRAFPAVVRRRPGARLYLAGRDADATALIRSTARQVGLGDTLVLLGPRDDVPELLCAADAFVLPSRWEGLGSVLLEAMALGAPIVASDLGAVREVVADGETARLARPEDPGALADAIVETLAGRTAARARAAAARERFLARFTIDVVADEMAAFYRRAMPAGRRGALVTAGRAPAER